MDDLPRLESLAQQLIGRVHDDDPEANLRWLRAQLNSERLFGPATEAERLLFVLAAAVPTDCTWRQLTAWAVDEPVEKAPSRLQVLDADATRKLRARLRKEAAHRPVSIIAA